MDLFEGFTEEQLAAIQRHKIYRVLGPGEFLFKEGDVANSMYVILEGSVEVFRPTATGEFHLAKLGCNKPLGEMGMIVAAGRTASARAVLPSALLELPAKLPEIVENDLGPAATLQLLVNIVRIFAHRLDERNDRLALPRSAVAKPGDAFEKEIDAALQGLEARLTTQASVVEQVRRLAPGKVLIHEGDQSDGFYFIHAGEIEIVVSREGKSPRVLKTLTAPIVVGEIGFFLGEPHSATVRASAPCVVTFFSGERFRRLQRENPRDALRIMYAAVKNIVVKIVT